MAGEIEQNPSPTTSENTSFFRKMSHRFDHICLPDNEEIPTRSFLDACQSIVPIFDLLGPTLFSPVKNDIEGNITKLSTKHKMDADKFCTLQQMLLQEIQDPEACHVNNAIDSLLWLKRALEFINVFFQEFLSGNPSLSDCAHKAYSKTLKPFHGFLVRGIFTLVVHAVPSRSSFADMLVPLTEGKSVEEQDAEIVDDSKENFKALQNILRILNDFYKEQNIDSDAVV